MGEQQLYLEELLRRGLVILRGFDLQGWIRGEVLHPSNRSRSCLVLLAGTWLFVLVILTLLGSYSNPQRVDLNVGLMIVL